MYFGWRPSALMIATALALQPSVCSAQSNIGNAASVRNQVEGITRRANSSLLSGSAVHSNELIRSGDEAVANLVFLDQTKLSVGPKSEVRLDKFVYDPDKQTGAVVVQASRGAYAVCHRCSGLQELSRSRPPTRPSACVALSWS